MIEMMNKASYVVMLLNVLLYISRVSASETLNQKSYLNYHIDQPCSKRIMAEYILRENECKDYMERNKQKILQNIITSQLIVNKQKIELNNVSEILHLAEKFKPLEEATKNQILIMKNANEINFPNKIKGIVESRDIQNGIIGIQKSESMEQSIEDTINKSSQQLIEEETYFTLQTENMKKYKDYFLNQLQILESEGNSKNQKEEQVAFDKKKNSFEQNEQNETYDDLDSDDYSNSRLSEEQQKDPNFWKQQLELLQESHSYEVKRSNNIITQIQKEIDVLENILGSIRNQNEKQQDLKELSDLMGILESINFDIEPLKSIQNVYDQQQPQQQPDK